MKTLKYLMLLLAVALALPAMAQEMKKVSFEKADKEPAKKISATEGKLSKHFSYIVSGGENLVAEVYNDKMSLRMEKNGAGQKKLTCSAKSAAICPHGFEFVSQNEVELAPTIIDEKMLVKEEKQAVDNFMATEVATDVDFSHLAVAAM